MTLEWRWGCGEAVEVLQETGEREQNQKGMQ